MKEEASSREQTASPIASSPRFPVLPSRRSFPELVVPEGCYFIMGDNRDDSYDPRYFGFVHADKVYGRASHVVVSFDPQHYYLPRAGRWMKPLV